MQFTESFRRSNAPQPEVFTIWVDPVFGPDVGQQVLSTWKRMIKDHVWNRPSTIAGVVDVMDFQAEVACMKIRAYFDAVEVMAAEGGPAAQDVAKMRWDFEERIAPGNGSDDSIGQIFAARSFETSLRRVMEKYDLGVFSKDNVQFQAESPFESEELPVEADRDMELEDF